MEYIIYLKLFAMKTKKLLFCFMLGIGLFSACQQEEEMQEILDGQEPVRTRSGCLGNGDCLPEIFISGGSSYVTISWNFYSYSEYGCREFVLSYNVTGDVSVNRVITSGGSVTLSVPSTYTLTVSVRCGGEKCSFCGQTLKFTKTPNDNGILSSLTDCNREYEASYFENFLNKEKLELRFQKTDRTMLPGTLIPDRYSFVTYNSKTREYFNNGGARISQWPFTVRIPDEEPYLTHYIRLYSTDCKYFEEHYLEGNISNSISSINFAKVNLHPKSH